MFALFWLFVFFYRIWDAKSGALLLTFQGHTVKE